MRLQLAWSNLYPLWIETRGGKFFTTTYQDDGLVSWAFVVAQHTSGLFRRDSFVTRLYPFWDSAPRCTDAILGVWNSYHEAKAYLLTTKDELCYIAAGWVLDEYGRAIKLPHEGTDKHIAPEIKMDRPREI